MFAYCLNNPANFLDSEGSSAICVTNGDRNPLLIGHIGLGGGGGGGYGGSGNSGYKDIIEEISDKTNKALRPIGTFAEHCWDAYVHSNELQVQQQYQQDMAVRDHFEDAFSSPERLNEYLVMVVTDISAYTTYVKFATASTVTFGPVAGVLAAAAGATLTTLSYYGVIDLSGLTWEDLLG